MIRIAVVGLGKMGISHLAIINAKVDVEVVAICDSAQYLLDVLNKYTGVKTYTNYEQMLNDVQIDAVIVATPSRFHFEMVQAALKRGIHVLCEKPFTLDRQQAQELTDLAESRKLVNQVGYHYRFVGAFQEAKRILDFGVLGKISHVLAEAYGPVVLKPTGTTWRTQRSEGGGCLYDYAAHPLNLINWYFGMPEAVGGTALNKIFSRDTDDEVYTTLYYKEGLTAQLSVNWSDESYRKMSTKISIWGTHGRIYADRQEFRVFLRNTSNVLEGYRRGWNVRYTTELTAPVDFYLRGEEYSAQLDYFTCAIAENRVENINSFASAAQTDHVIAMMTADSEARLRTPLEFASAPMRRKRFSPFSRLI